MLSSFPKMGLFDENICPTHPARKNGGKKTIRDLRLFCVKKHLDPPVCNKSCEDSIYKLSTFSTEYWTWRQICNN